MKIAVPFTDTDLDGYNIEETIFSLLVLYTIILSTKAHRVVILMMKKINGIDVKKITNPNC